MSSTAEDGPISFSSTPLGTGLPQDNVSSGGMEEVQQDSMVEDDQGVKELNMDIREELKHILSSGLERAGSFSFNKAYPEAPNPVLNVASLGMVGLPLSTREVEAVKSVAQQAPFSEEGTQTVDDTSARHAWEIDGSQMSFKNAQWETFMTEVVNHVCESLGIHVAARAPRCEISKLLLYQTGSHFLSNVDMVKTKGVVATIIVVLPSEFTGGEARFTHSGLSTVYNPSQNDEWQTTVMAWYTDVLREIKPITSGHCLAISYDLILSKNTLKPALSDSTAGIQRLRQILTSWQKNEGHDLPQKIVYLLENSYPEGELRGSALKGSDAQLVAVLDTLAKESEFHLGLATAECHLEGIPDESAKDHGGPGAYGWGYDYESSDEESFDGDFQGVTDRSVELKEFVDLDGNSISDSLILDSKMEAIPSDLTEEAENGDYESQELEGYMGEHERHLQRWYRRTVLVLWPQWADFDVRYAGSNFVKLCQTLDGMSTTDHMPTPRDVSLAQLVLSHLESDSKTVTPSIMRIACAWGDYSLWTNVVAKAITAGHCDSVQLQDVFLGIQKFAFDSVKPSLELLLQHLTSNKSRHETLDALHTWTLQQCLANADTVVLPWIFTRYEELLKSLLKPQRGEEELLISLSVTHGGVDALRNLVLPQLISAGDPEFLREFAAQVHSTGTLPDGFKVELVREALKAAINECSFDEITDPTLSVVRPTRPQADVSARSMIYVQTSFDTGMYDLVDEIIDKLLPTIAPPYTPQTHAQVKAEALALLYAIRQYMENHHDPIVPPITKTEALLHACISAYVDRFQNGALPEISKPEIETLLQVVQLPGGAQEFATRLLPSIMVISPKITSNVLRIIAEELYAVRNAPLLPAERKGPGIPAAVTAVAKRLAAVAPLSRSTTILKALDFCAKVDATEACSSLITRAIDMNKLRADDVETVLIPLLSPLRDFAEKHPTLDFAQVLQTVLLAWMDNVLGQPAPQRDFSAAIKTLKEWPCPRKLCKSARKFILEDRKREHSFEKIAVRNVRHMQVCIASYASPFVTYEIIRSNPQGIKISKTDAWFEPTRWELTREKGCTILRSITPDEQLLKRLLGPHYDRITQTIRSRAATAQHAQRPSGTNAGPQTSAVRNTWNLPPKPTYTASHAYAPTIANQSNIAGPSVQRMNKRPAEGAPPAKRHKT
ncbi:hypothetical protein K474DRAFT_1704394 [Panus rudis PR-1116 ss-1]|nr:hypothetical protein K474DRAFT_1704394 [Panus rudis PR-1116 ss-1]